MSWYSPRMPSGAGSAPRSSSSFSSTLNKEPPPPPETPAQVRDLGVGVCYDLGAFRELMRQYRLLDDGVTTRLNRTIAKARSSGQTHSPSLLYSPPPPSSSSSSSPSSSSPSSSSQSATTSTSTGSNRFSSSLASDLGTTTYIASDEACAAFWKELVGYWKGRQDVLRYCIDVVDAGVGSKVSGNDDRGSTSPTSGTSMGSGRGGRDERELDADFHGNVSTYPPPTTKVGGAEDSQSLFSGWDDRGSRTEQSDEALRRLLHNEETIDSIIRTRSLQAFKSRCNLFRLPMNASEGEKKFWSEGSR